MKANKIKPGMFFNNSTFWEETEKKTLIQAVLFPWAGQPRASGADSLSSIPF